MNRTETVRRILLPILATLMLLPRVSAAECPHEYVRMRQEPTCVNRGAVWLVCILCDDTRDYETIPALGHSFSDWYVLEEPTCTQPGTQARDCVVCLAQETASIPHLGHTYHESVIPPSCTARGYTEHYCPGCGDRYRTDYVPALGHRYDYGTITKEPTWTAMGRMRYTCLGCGDTYLETIPILTNPFCDIAQDVYYTTPVLWAAGSGITAGVDATHFAPDQPCNRAQVVTFLWRRAGKPTPQSRENPFRDVPAGSFYEQAVLWAYQQGITTGIDADIFSPDTTCNRAQVVTFLHRFRGCPEPFLTVSFPDVPTGSFYHKAVLWAAEKEITLGMDGGRFCPNLTCNRAQIVTFLYRDAKNP